MSQAGQNHSSLPCWISFPPCSLIAITQDVSVMLAQRVRCDIVSPFALLKGLSSIMELEASEDNPHNRCSCKNPIYQEYLSLVTCYEILGFIGVIAWAI